MYSSPAEERNTYAEALVKAQTFAEYNVITFNNTFFLRSSAESAGREYTT